MVQLISIVLPVYNEEKNLPTMYAQLSKIIDDVPQYHFEVIFVNDGSKDGSWNYIKQLNKIDKRIKGISFSRNFGHQLALSAGYDRALGDAIITLDADLQHPLQLIPQMIARWQQGFSIVYVRNVKRTDSFLKKITAQWYYRLLEQISYIQILHNVQDFRLIDKKVLTVIRSSKEQTPYLRGMVAWTGFSYTIIDGEYADRSAGSSGYSWRRMLKLAFDGVTGFSLFPLKIACYVGIFVVMTGMMMFAYITIDALLYRVHYPLFKWLVTIIYIFIGVLFILLWFLGEYIGRMYELLLNRPRYVIAEEVNGNQASYEMPLNPTKEHRSDNFN